MATIMAVGAHPDDLEFGMAGTLVKFSNAGHKVVLVVLTKGEMGTKGTPEQRIEEMKKSASLINADLEILDFKDAQVFDNNEGRLKVAEVVRKHKPDLVFAPYHTLSGSHLDGRSHPDHIGCGKIVRNALRLAKFKKVELTYPEHTAKKLIYYFSPRDQESNLIVDVTNEMEKAIELMKSHSSQLDGSELLDYLVLWRKSAGMKIKVKYAECFFTDEVIKVDVDDLLKS